MFLKILLNSQENTCMVTHYCQRKKVFLPIKKVKNIIGTQLPTDKKIFFLANSKNVKVLLAHYCQTEKKYTLVHGCQPKKISEKNKRIKKISWEM